MIRRRLAAFFLLFATQNAHAGKVDLSFGYFSINAKTSKGEADFSNIGSYALGYRHEVFPSVEVSLGYSLLMASIIGGDMSYGLDLGSAWYPFTRAGASHWSSETAQFAMLEIWRPFVSAGFSQRQIRQTSYAGLAGGVGVERSLTTHLSLRGEARSLLLTGPSPASATQLDFLLGISYGL
jgi:hypothetical protein